MSSNIEKCVKELVWAIKEELTPTPVCDELFPNAGKPWTEPQRWMLYQHWRTTEGDVPRIARRMGRTECAIRCQIARALKEYVE